MNDNLNSLAFDTACIAINTMSTEELRAISKTVAHKLGEKAEYHHNAIMQAINNALADGFDVTFSVEGTDDFCVMRHDDRIKFVHVH